MTNLTSRDSNTPLTLHFFSGHCFATWVHIKLNTLLSFIQERLSELHHHIYLSSFSSAPPNFPINLLSIISASVVPVLSFIFYPSSRVHRIHSFIFYPFIFYLSSRHLLNMVPITKVKFFFFFIIHP